MSHYLRLKHKVKILNLCNYLFQVKIKYDLFLTPSMELLYADPKRVNVKKTSVFYRLEKITISHADPKFIKLLELGGAQVNIFNGYVPW